MAPRAGPTAPSSTAAIAGRRRFSARRQAGRPRRLHRAQHARAARVVLRGAADRRRARADQLPAGRRRLPLPDSSTAAPRSCAPTPTTSRPSIAIRADLHATSRTSSRSTGAARRLAGLRIARDGGSAEFRSAGDRRARSADDQLHQRHDVAAEGRDDHASQRLGELRRHAGAHADDAGAIATSGRCRCSTPTAGRSRGR